MVVAGARAFWGYTTNFTFYHSDPTPGHLVDDNLAAAYLTMDIIIDRGILARKTATDLHFTDQLCRSSTATVEDDRATGCLLG
jgi:hypothetical protein